MTKKHIAIITSGYLPVPNVMGGAVEALDMMLIKENEKEHLFDFTVFSSYTPAAEKAARDIAYTTFNFVKPSCLIRFADRCIYWSAKHLFRRTHLMSYRYIAQRMAYIHSVSKKLSAKDFDAVIIENHASLFMTLKHFHNAEKYKGKVYYHLHNEVKSTYGCAKEISTSKKILGVSNFIVDTLNQRLHELGNDGLTPSQKTVWKNCVDIDQFNPGNLEVLSGGRKLREQLGIPSNDIVFLFSGRLTPEKGATQLLEAFLDADIPEATLVIAGSFFFNSDIASPFEKQLHDLAEKAGNRIKFTGFIDYSDMPAVYSMADICCLPSIWDDPAPLAVIESLASGKPLITTNSGGIPEYASENSSYIFERDENLISNLIRAMKELSANDSKRRSMASCARKDAAKLGSSQYIYQLQNLLTENSY